MAIRFVDGDEAILSAGPEVGTPAVEIESIIKPIEGVTTTIPVVDTTGSQARTLGT